MKKIVLQLLMLFSSTIFFLSNSSCEQPLSTSISAKMLDIGCEKDSDCQKDQPGAWRCNLDLGGVCTCANDEACGEGSYCSSTGVCTFPSGCHSNKDCEVEQFCDTSKGSGVCLPKSIECSKSSHCPTAHYCLEQKCVAGCLSNSDCSLDDPCIAGVCITKEGACNHISQCNFGEFCNEKEERCVEHRAISVLCEFCLLDHSKNAPIPCDGEPCIEDLSIARVECRSNNDCANKSRSFCEEQICEHDSECPLNATCIKGPQGFGICSKKYCVRRFCGTQSCDDVSDPCPKGYSCLQRTTPTKMPCEVDKDTCKGGRKCSAESEDLKVGFCSCNSDLDCSHAKKEGAKCINPGPAGYCLLGSTCAPSSGLTCDVLYQGLQKQ